MSETVEQAERIASEGTNVRERVRDLVSERAREGRKSLRELTEETRDILRGAGEGVRDAAEEHRGEVLGDVIDGVSDGLSRAAQATKLALEEAEGRGERFAEEDLRQAVDDLQAMEKLFVESVSGLVERSGTTAWQGVKDAGAHAQRAAESMRPSIQSALETAVAHPVKLAGEAAGAGAAVTGKAVGSLFEAVGGLLSGAGEALRGERKKGGERGGSKG